MNTHRSLHKILALLFSVALVFAAMPVTVYAAESGDGCAHVHDELCGFEIGVPCGHEHDGDCGYAEAIPGIPCDMNCEGDIHADGCSYTPAIPVSDCTHDHDESCGYIEATPCTHIHDENCGGLPLSGNDLALGEPGEPGIGCVCESRCAEDAINEDCPVCAEDFTLCGISEQEPSVTEDVIEPDTVESEPESSTDEVKTEPTTQNGLANTFEELQSMLDEGGTVTLGASIIIPAEETLTLNGMASVNTSGSGIRIEGLLQLEDGAVITGEGVSQPVVEVAAGGSLLSYGSSFEQAPYISATGDGGCGLFLRAGVEEYDESRSFFLRIAANGADGAAVRSEVSVHLSRYLIEAPDGVGVVCPEDVSLFLCQITAGTAAVEAPGFTADTCILSPMGDAGGTYISRKITKLANGRELISKGEAISDFHIEHYSESNQWEATLSAEGYPDKIMMIGLAVEFPEIDTNVVGSYPLPVTLDECWEAFDLLPEDKDLITIEVYDPEIPCFYRAYSFWFGGYYVDYYFGGDLSKWTLWRSDDEGESWYDYTAEAELEWDEGYAVTVAFPEPVGHPVLLVWEAEGIGETEVLRLSWDGDTISGDLGGDRGGGGRGETELTPTDSGDDPSAMQPPETQPTNSGDDDNPPSTGTPETPPTDPGDSDEQPFTPTPTPETTPSDPGDGGNQSDDTGNDNSAVTPTPTPTQPPTVPVGGGSNTPAPTPAAVSSAPSPKNAPVIEQEEPSTPEPAVMPDEVVGERGITVSGKRLAAMIETRTGSVPFWSGELSVVLPASWLQGLALGEKDSFAVSLWQPEENSFTVSFSVNGIEITDRLDKAFLISLPWDGGSVSCTSADGETTDAKIANGRAEFSLFDAGTYTLTEKQEPAAAVVPVDNAPSPVEPVTLSAPTQQENGMGGWTAALLIGGPIAVCAGTVFGIRRRRLVKR